MSTKATKGTKASKAKANKAIKAGKGNASRKKSNNPVLVNNKPIDEVPASPELDILMSVELVQTAVAAIFFDIIWLRKVFPDHDWQYRNYYPSNPKNSYDAYVEGPDFISNESKYGRWHVPKRGEDARVDKLMDTLESCAKEPIENHWLKKLQLCFHLADGNDLSEANLIESYSLTFKHDKGRISPRLSTRSKTAPTDEPSMTLFEGRHTLGKMVDKLFHNLYECDKRGNRLRLYPLPAHFRMIFLAEYNDSAPRGYQPPYFKPGDPATNSILNLCESDDRFVMDTGYHVVSAGLLLPGPEDHPMQSLGMLGNTINLPNSQTSLPLSGISNSLGTNRLPQHKHNLGLQTATVDDGTQREAVHQLRDVGLSRENLSTTQDTQQLRQYLSTPQRSSESRHPPLAPPYTQDIINHLQNRLLELTSTNRGDDLDEPQGVGYKEDPTVKCDCGCQERHENMIYCVECQNLQHPECYGYLDQKQPANHLCYSCLVDLYPEEKPQLDAAADLCVKRFTLHFLREQQTAVSYEALAEYLGRDLECMASIVERLDELGLVQTKKHRGRTARYIGNDEILLKEYFRPQKYINNLFANVDASYADNLLGLKAVNAHDKVNKSDASFCTPNGTENRRLPASGPSQRHTVDDDTTQGEPSPQPATRTPIRLVTDSHHLQSIARSGLNLGQGDFGTPTPKRPAEFGSPMEAVKRPRTIQTSPFIL